MRADSELTPAEEQELMTFVAAHPELGAELKAYDLTRLSPDEEVVYSEKESLLRSEPSKRVIAFPQWRRYAIAAGVALLVFVSFYKYREVNKSVEDITVTHTIPVTPGNVQPVVDTSASVLPRQEEAAKTGIATVTPAQVPAAVPNHKQHKIIPLVKEEKQEQVQEKEQGVAIVKDTVVPVRSVGTVEAPPQIVKKTQPADHVDTVIAAPVLPIAEVQQQGKTKKKSLIDRLPIDESNKHQLKNLFRIAKSTYNGVSKAKQELDGGEINR